MLLWLAVLATCTVQSLSEFNPKDYLNAYCEQNQCNSDSFKIKEQKVKGGVLITCEDYDSVVNAFYHSSRPHAISPVSTTAEGDPFSWTPPGFWCVLATPKGCGIVLKLFPELLSNSEKSAQVLDIARGEIGHCTRSKYTDWYADLTNKEYFREDNVPYSAIFLSWVFHTCAVGCSGFPLSYIPLIRKAAERNFSTVSARFVSAGDVAVFESNHIAIIERIDTSKITCIEGDISGCVDRVEYNLNDAICIIRPNYADASFSVSDTCNTNGPWIRSGPDPLYTSLKSLEKGESISLDGYEVGSWIHVKSGNTVGWLDKRFSTLYSGAGQTSDKWIFTVTCMGDSVYIRNATSNGVRLGQAYYGNEMKHDGAINGSWAHVKFGDIEGWMSINYVKF